MTWAHTKRGAARTYTHHAHSLPVSCILSLTFSLTALSLPPSRALLTLSYTHTNSRLLSRLLAHTTTSAHTHTPSHTLKLLHTRSLSHILAHSSLPPSLTRSPHALSSPSLARTQTLARSLACSLTQLPLPTHTRPPTLSNSYIHALSLSPTHWHTTTIADALAHALPVSLTHCPLSHTAPVTHVGRGTSS